MRLYDVAKTATGAAWRGEIRRAMRWRKRAIRQALTAIYEMHERNLSEPNNDET